MLLSKLNFDPYQSNTTPSLCEAKIKLCISFLHTASMYKNEIGTQHQIYISLR